MKIRDNFGELMENCQLKKLKMEYQYTWVIKDFRNCYSNYEHYDESPSFLMGRSDEYEMKLRIYLDGYYDKGWIEISPVLVNQDSHENVKFLIEISILNNSDQEEYTERLVLTKQNLGDVYKFAQRSRFQTTNSSLLLNGDLRISFRISFDAPTTLEETIETQYSQYYQKSQFDNFEQLCGNEEFSDFKLVIGKIEVSVHQAILATRSPVFKAMFLSNMRESKEKKVYIDDVDPEIMMKVLKYIYSGKIDKIQKFAEQMFLVADKYQLDSLKEICEDILIDQLSVDNIYKMFEFLDNHGAENLKKKALHFFKKNFEKLAAADDFKSTISSLPVNLQTDIICATAKTN